MKNYLNKSRLRLTLRFPSSNPLTEHQPGKETPEEVKEEGSEVTVQTTEAAKAAEDDSSLGSRSLAYGPPSENSLNRFAGSEGPRFDVNAPPSSTNENASYT